MISMIIPCSRIFIATLRIDIIFVRRVVMTDNTCTIDITVNMLIDRNTLNIDICTGGSRNLVADSGNGRSYKTIRRIRVGFSLAIAMIVIAFAVARIGKVVADSMPIVFIKT